MKLNVLYVGPQQGIGTQVLYLVNEPSGTTRVFNPNLHRVVGRTEGARERGFEIPFVLRITDIKDWHNLDKETQERLVEEKEIIGVCLNCGCPVYQTQEHYEKAVGGHVHERCPGKRGWGLEK